MGLTHLDAGVVIGLLNHDDPHHSNSREVLAEALHFGDRLEASASVYAECLVTPLRSGTKGAEVVTNFFARYPIRIIDIDQDIAFEAARLRSVHTSLRLPDAFVLATAIVRQANRLATTDGRWSSQVTKAVPLRIDIL